MKYEFVTTDKKQAETFKESYDKFKKDTRLKGLWTRTHRPKDGGEEKFIAAFQRWESHVFDYLDMKLRVLRSKNKNIKVKIGWTDMEKKNL